MNYENVKGRFDALCQSVKSTSSQTRNDKATCKALAELFYFLLVTKVFESWLQNRLVLNDAFLKKGARLSDYDFFRWLCLACYAHFSSLAKNRGSSSGLCIELVALDERGCNPEAWVKGNEDALQLSMYLREAKSLRDYEDGQFVYPWRDCLKDSPYREDFNNLYREICLDVFGEVSPTEILLAFPPPEPDVVAPNRESFSTLDDMALLKRETALTHGLNRILKYLLKNDAHHGGFVLRKEISKALKVDAVVSQISKANDALIYLQIVGRKSPNGYGYTVARKEL